MKSWKHLKDVLIQSAHKGNVQMLLSDEKIQEINQSACWYCGIFRQVRTIGVDRVNPGGNYEDDNVVPCCTICNFMKCDHQLDEWIEHLFKIKMWSDEYADNLLYPNNTFSMNWSKFLSSVKERGYHVEISEEEWLSYHSLPCIYCGDPSTGLERIDNKIGYVAENIEACCKTCNYMRGSWPQDVFLNHVIRILCYYCREEGLENTILYDDVPELYKHFGTMRK